MSRCCCGQVGLEDDVPLIHNDYQHEVLGPKGNFCGPKIKHTLRDERRWNDKLEKQLAAAVTALRWYARASNHRSTYSKVRREYNISPIGKDHGQGAREAIAEVKRLGKEKA